MPAVCWPNRGTTMRQVLLRPEREFIEELGRDVWNFIFKQLDADIRVGSELAGRCAQAAVNALQAELTPELRVWKN